MSNLAHILTDAAEANAQRTAVKVDDLEVSYAVLEHGTRHAAGLPAVRGRAQA